MTDRRTGSVGASADLKNTNPNNQRQTGSVGTSVDLKNTNPNNQRRTGAIGLNVDLQPIAGPTTYPITLTTSQPQSVSLVLLVCRLRPYSDLETSTYAALETQTYAQLEQICTAPPRTVTLLATQSQTIGLQIQGTSARTVAIIQATAVARVLNRFYQHVVTTTQSQTVRGSRIYALTLSIPNATQLDLLGQITRVLFAQTTTQPGLGRQIVLTRTLSQATSAHVTGLPVKLTGVTTIQARSLALGRAISLLRTIVQPTAAMLPRILGLSPSIEVGTVLDRVQAIGLSPSITQATAVSIQAANVTPRYFITLRLTQGQGISLQSTSTGAPAKVFSVCPTRSIIFATCQRQAHFAAPRRGVQFIVEVR